ncbi:E3 ubiquitin-protein ligase Topors-like [Amphibalanus amphitrite]|uniref:E3 ubiquitin-protein ligase Topors-like n=1 Tax=Amphibalanus amphitrite TaxID=1232801 RepID=UPI001C9252E1|nr:E3 ubiquitin-protein ligase Topors-like [Amphibalanus amphitrite]
MPADVECPATPPELPREPTPTRVKCSPVREGSSSPGRASPDSACPICLGKLDNKAFSDGCMHQFCFTCIVEWSKVRAVCPLCKQGFTSIIHNVRSEIDYDRYRLPPPPAAEPQNPYIFQPGDGPELRSRWLQMRRQMYRHRSRVLPMLWPVPEGHDYHLPAAPARPRPPTRPRLTSESRRHIYGSDMWARPTADELTGRYRETGPDFYRNNPACTHRLVPWLNRELNAVLDSPALLAHVMEHVMQLITRLHILSPEFRAHLEPYMSPWTEHFVHEFYCFARSPYDMVGYDLNVQYRQGRPDSPPMQVMASSGDSDSGSDSDIRVLTPPTQPSTPIRTERLSSPEPGPSGSAGRADRGVSAALGRVRAFLAKARAAESDSDSDMDSDVGAGGGGGSDSAVEVVEVLPPRSQRTPVIVTLSSDEEAAPPASAPPATTEATESERRRTDRQARRTAATTDGQRQKSRGTAEKRTRSDGDSNKRRRGEVTEKNGGVHTAHKRREKRPNREADRAERRAKGAEQRGASQSSRSSSRSKSSKTTASSFGGKSSSISMPTAASLATSSDASWRPTDSERSSVNSALSSRVSDRVTVSSDRTSIDVVGGTTDRSSLLSISSGKSTSASAGAIGENCSKPGDKSSDKSHKSKSSDKSSKSSKTSDRSHKSKSSDKSHKSKSSDKSHKSRSSDKSSHKSKSSDKSSHKSKHRDKSHKSKSSDKHRSSSRKSDKGDEKRDSDGRRHGRRSRDDARSQKRRRLVDSDSSDCLLSPGSPQPSTSSGVTDRSRQFHRIVPAVTSSSDAAQSSSSSVVGARPVRCRRLSDSASEGSSAADRRPAAAPSDSEEDVGARRPAVRSAVVRARRAVRSEDSDSSDW